MFKTGFLSRVETIYYITKQCLWSLISSCTFLPLPLSHRCIWAGRPCVLRVSTSSCWAAGTETARSAHLSLTSTPFLRRTPWTWCKVKQRSRIRRKGLCVHAYFPQWEDVVVATRMGQTKRETGLLAFIFCTFWVDGAERPLVRF